MIKMKLFSFVILILASQNVVSQSLSYKEYIDSLKLVLHHTTEISVKVEASNEIAVRYLYSIPDSTIKYAELAILLSEKTDELTSKLWTLGILGEAYIYKGNLPKTLELGLMAIELNGDTPFEVSFLGPTYYNLSELYFQIEDYDKSLFYAKEMVRIGKANSGKDKMAEAYGYYLSAQVYEKLEMPDKALLNLELSFPIFEEYGDRFFAVGAIGQLDIDQAVLFEPAGGGEGQPGTLRLAREAHAPIHSPLSPLAR